MIFVDSSVIVAIVALETDAAALAKKLETDSDRISAGHVILESSMRLATLLNVTPTIAAGTVTRLLHEADIKIVPITEEIAHISVSAFERYGKGRNNRAGLNFGDCFAYALAKITGEPLLFKGEDFKKTDITSAL